MDSSTLKERDHDIVRLAERYRLLTNGALRRHLFADLSPNAVSKITARLCSLGFLNRYPLLPPENYFTPGPEAVRQLGVAARRSEPLGPQALPTDYAVLVYAMHGRHLRQRLTADEVEQSAAWLPDRLRHAAVCSGKDKRLDLVRVDLGGSPQHVARRLAADAAQLDGCHVLPEQMNHVQLVMLTTSGDKASLIRDSLQALDWCDSVRIHLAVIPRLTCLQLRTR